MPFIEQRKSRGHEVESKIHREQQAAYYGYGHGLKQFGAFAQPQRQQYGAFQHCLFKR